jgi:hypothetical protein
MSFLGTLKESDEAGYVEYAENVIIALQKAARAKHNMEYFRDGLLGTCVKLEELAYGEALRETVQEKNALWNSAEALSCYEHICEDMLRALEGADPTLKNWPTRFAENPPGNLFHHLTGRSRISGSAINGDGDDDAGGGTLASRRSRKRGATRALGGDK